MHMRHVLRFMPRVSLQRKRIGLPCHASIQLPATLGQNVVVPHVSDAEASARLALASLDATSAATVADINAVTVIINSTDMAGNMILNMATTPAPTSVPQATASILDLFCNNSPVLHDQPNCLYDLRSLPAHQR